MFVCIGVGVEGTTFAPGPNSLVRVLEILQGILSCKWAACKSSCCFEKNENTLILEYMGDLKGSSIFGSFVHRILEILQSEIMKNMNFSKTMDYTFFSTIPHK